MLSVLRTLGSVQLAGAPRLQNLDIEFRGAVAPGDDYAIETSQQGETLSVELHDGGRSALIVRMSPRLETAVSTVPDMSWTTAVRRDASLREYPAGAFEHPQEVAGRYETGEVPEGYGLPLLAPVQVRVLALCSYVVGMEVPGLKSMFTHATLRFGEDLADSSELFYRVRTTRFDRQFRILDAAIDVVTSVGRLIASGELRSYVRFSPAAVEPRKLASCLAPDAATLKGKVALVCGGTRGLGANLAAALAMEGCHTYASFREDGDAATELAETVAPLGARIDTIRGDAGDAAWCASTLDTIRARHGRLDLVVLNACAPPSPLPPGPDSASQFNQYVTRNLPLALTPLAVFLPALAETGGALVCISSSFVEERPAGFAHYVALKEAVESAVRELAPQAKGVFALIARPPRLQTSWNDTPAAALGTIPADWAAAHIVNRLAERWRSGGLEVLSAFPPLETLESDAPDAGAPDYTLAVAASFTAEPLAPGLGFWFRELGLRVHVAFAPYGQVLQSLLDPASTLADNRRGLNVVLLRAKDWLRELPGGESRNIDFVRTFLSEACRDIERAMKNHRAQASVDTLLVLCPSDGGGPREIEEVLETSQQQLAEVLAGVPGLSVVNARSLHGTYGVDESKIHDALREHIAHIPYTGPYFHVLATILARHLHGKLAPVRKVVVADCDNTLWRGVVGEVGVEGLEFDPGHQLLHEKLARLSSSGLQIALCSKNVESDVWRVFDQRSELRLPRSAVIAAAIGWQPKSESLRALASRLNVGLESFIFIDDNPAECAEVRTNAPEVLTLEWPQDDEQARRLLEHAWELDETPGTAEDRRRTQMYREEFQRQEFRASALSFRDFLDSLNLVVDVRPLDVDDVKRASQLALRTNQFNFTTRRRDESEMRALLSAGTHQIRTVRVRDRFGDYGLVGLLIAEARGELLVVDTFLMSCRALGRGAEHRMAAELAQIAETLGASRVRMIVFPTARNAPAQSFLKAIAPNEFIRVSAAAIECDLPAAHLRGLRFEPVEGSTEPGAVEEAAPAPTRGPRVDAWYSPRNREQLITRTVSSLCTMAELENAIGRRHMTKTPTAARSTESIAVAVVEAFADALRLPAAEVRKADRFEALGCDSFKIVEITVALSERFPWLPSTLLFEHRSVSEIVRHICSLSAGRPEPAGAHAGRMAAEAGGNDRAAADIAVVGLDVRTAGARSAAELWKLLSEGRVAVGRVPQERKHFIGRLSDKRPHWAGLVDDVDLFDAEFFGISPREAELMDPQLRMFLEVAWRALEDAGCTAMTLDSDTGVFVGVMYSDYARSVNEALRGTESPYKSWESFSLANRLSQVLGLRGPSMAIDTACSSSATALHLACRALRDGDCRLAIVGGVNLVIDPDRFVQLGKLGILSPTGRCLAFGAEADGTVIGEGVGVVVLRPLNDAVERGDRIYGVIKGTGISTGSGTIGFTAPNPQAQAEAILRALRAARIDPRTIRYVETHGTGTLLGDPIEIRGLDLAYSREDVRDLSLDGAHRCAIGSIKPNVGHLEAGAGVVSLIKVLLQLDRRMLVPSVTSAEPNPQIAFADTPFFVQRTLEPWPPTRMTVNGESITVPRRAGLNSFGVGGSNVHLIIEEAPRLSNEGGSLHSPEGPEGLTAPCPPAADRPWQVLALSARSDEALDRVAGAFRVFLSSKPETPLTDICYSANTLRRHFERRLVAGAATREEMIEALTELSSGGTAPNCVRGAIDHSGNRPKVAFLFTGQGSQYVGMGRALYEKEPVFRKALQECGDILKSYLNASLLDVLHSKSQQDSRIDQTAFAQPALFAIEYALAELWKSWGIRPDAVLGHSVGEYAAACIAGVFSLEDGLKLIAARGRLMQAQPRDGSMVVVLASESVVKQAIAPYLDTVSIASYNGPNNIVISGDAAHIQTIVTALEASGIETVPLNVSHAFHSPLMRPMLVDFDKVALGVAYRAPQLELISNVTGAIASGEVATPEYWSRHIIEPVRFAAGMAALHGSGCDTFLEIGPKPVLLGMGRRCLPSGVGTWAASLRPGQDDGEQMLLGLAQVYASGGNVDWVGFYKSTGSRRVQLPAYSFERNRFWPDFLRSRDPVRSSAQSGPEHPLLGRRLALATQETVFESWLSPDAPAFLKDHRVFEHAVLPLSGYLSMVFPAILPESGSEQAVLTDLVIGQAFVLPAGGVRTNTILVPNHAGFNFRICSLPEQDRVGENAPWLLHADGRIRVEPAGALPGRADIDKLRAGFGEEVSVAASYDQFRQTRSLDYGPSFRAIEHLWLKTDEALGRIRIPAPLAADAERYSVHPVLLDAAFQVLMCSFPSAAKMETYLPVGLEHCRVCQRTGVAAWSHARLRPSVDGDRETLTGDVRVFDEAGGLILEATGFSFKRASRQAVLRNLQVDRKDWLHEVSWVQKARPDQAAAEGRPGQWLILADSGSVGRGLAQQLRDRGHRCVLILRGEKFEQLGDDTVHLNPAHPEHFDRLLAECDLKGRLPWRGVVHLWGLDTASIGSSGVGEDSQLIGFGAALHLVQAFLRLASPECPRLYLVTRGVQPPGDTPPTTPEHATLWGLGRVIRQEHPEFRCVLIDLEAVNMVDELTLLAAELSSSDEEDEIALRSSGRYVARLTRQPRRVKPDGPSFDAQSSYLVTGGLGTLGLKIVRWMFDKGARHLILTGRGGPTDASRLVLNQLTEAGAHLLIASADVSDIEQLAGVFAQVDVSMPPLRGVIHAAGVLDQGELCELTWDRSLRVLAAKVEGTRNLHTLTEKYPLEFFVCFSSISAVLGSARMGSYAAANAFMDAFAHRRRALGLPALSINWGPWAEGGMAARMPDRDRLGMTAIGLGEIESEQGLQVLAELMMMNGSTAQVVAAPLNWKKHLAPFPAGQYPSLFRQMAEEVLSQQPETRGIASQRDLVEQLRQADPASRLPLLAKYVHQIVARVLGQTPERIPPAAFLNRIGLDSLMALELRNQIATDLLLDVPMVRFLQNVSVTSLAALLDGEFAKASHASGSASKYKRSSDATAVDGQLTDGLNSIPPSQRHQGTVIEGEI
jgi:FkbH-like protein